MYNIVIHYKDITLLDEIIRSTKKYELSYIKCDNNDIIITGEKDKHDNFLKLFKYHREINIIEDSNPSIIKKKYI